MPKSVVDRLAERAEATSSTMRDVVNSIQAIPYGRPAERSIDGTLREWRGTCSTKHALLVGALQESWPETQPRVVHRVYRVSPTETRERFGSEVAAAVPPDGLTGVHRFVVVRLEGREVVLDVTFPDTPPWDGASSMNLACGSGTDYPVRWDADVEKRALEAEFCDPDIREPFIGVLATRRTIPEEAAQ